MDLSTDIIHYANEQASARLGKLAFQVQAAARSMDADAIHDLRVAIRRFNQSLTVFAALYPKREAKKIRKRLGRVMEVAGEIRDRDIALEFFAEAGVRPEDPLSARIAGERKLTERTLAEKVTRWNRTNFSAKWRSALQLNLP